MEISKNQRILWLLNHTTLRDAEVPMLLRLGFEVYIPKIVPFDEANRSASITYAYDSSLSIPEALLQKLNSFDFYTQEWPKALAKEINEYFVTAIVPIFPKMVDATCEAFRGSIYLRIFGLAGDQTYADMFKSFLSKRAFSRIRKGEGIWMAANIATTIDNEPQWVRRNSVYLPAGLPLDFYSHENQWRGDNSRMFFVCPRIKSSAYYNQIYRDFKKTFGDFPHIIAGAQPLKIIGDPYVTGFVEQKEYIELFKSSKVMYYHSTEERHLHYHPIESIVYGLPVIFMSGGVLEFLAKRKLPGCCDTPEEARIKIRRILNGDEVFTQDVIQSQKVLLKEFDTQYVENCWRQRFVSPLQVSYQERASSSPQKQLSEITHIGIWMHETSEDGFTGEGISRLQAMVVRGAMENPNLQIHLAAVSWVKDAIISYMDDLGVDTKRLSFIFVDEKPPLVFQLYNWWIKRRPRQRIRLPFLVTLRRFLRKIYAELGTRFIIIRTGPRLYLAALLAVVLLPLILIIGIPIVLFKVFTILTKLLIHTLKMSRIANFMLLGMNLTKGSLLNFAIKAYRRMVNAELRLLAKKAGSDKKFAAWFFAYPSNENIGCFLSPTIIAVPDIVYINFPSLYSREITNPIESYFNSIKQTIGDADAVITFSDYVGQHHVIKPGYKPKEDVIVIRHAPIETRSLISSRPGVSDDELHLLSRRVIKSYVRKQTQNQNNKEANYLRSLNLGEIDYLFISSQSRLHKNHLNLLKAYRSLLREKYINLKIIFTGDLSADMQMYITEQRLHLDVISLHYMPPMVHASFYACAKLTVVPTLFEGGFPFVFSESLSVNTPVVISNIPAVREVLSEDEQNLFCFDPYNTQDMANKIQWALENRSSLLDAQTKTFDRMKTRTWKNVAEEYINVFTSVKKTGQD